MEAFEKVIKDARQAVADLKRKIGASTTAAITIPVQLPEQITPTDKPIDKATALFNYVVVLLLSKPDVDHETLLFLTEGMDGSLSSHLYSYEEAETSTSLRMDELRNRLDLDYNDLADEDDEDFNAADAKRNARLLPRIKKNEEALAKLEPKYKFLKQADLRFFLAHTINQRIHKHRDISHETLISRALKAHLDAPPSPLAIT